jgi:hypothetical protein
MRVKGLILVCVVAALLEYAVSFYLPNAKKAYRVKSDSFLSEVRRSVHEISTLTEKFNKANVKGFEFQIKLIVTSIYMVHQVGCLPLLSFNKAVNLSGLICAVCCTG